ncbi:hypothetical protein BB561_002003 [Smittium simulii]|uniref:Large ribosomal subunit protein uL6 alpha-beta domain-containing protein n=1 Tax=Smittium simulii TaxID=133385 RepID=A0A2T9YS46_9FUNG|nr:hypothetical protein BB561_002003 [Smittium simulii]
MMLINCCNLVKKNSARLLHSEILKQGLNRSFSTTSTALSNIGKLPIRYPDTIKIDLSDKPFSETDARYRQTSTLTILGPLGNLKQFILPFVNLKISEPVADDSNSASNSSENETSYGTISVSVEDSLIKKQRQMWGTTRSLIQNMITGVTEGFTATLKLVGVGYRASIEKINNVEVLQLKLGYAQPVNISIPSNLSVKAPFPTVIIVKGIDFQQVKLYAAKIRAKKKPEPYNQKGIFVNGETIKKKEGKKK